MIKMEPICIFVKWCTFYHRISIKTLLIQNNTIFWISVLVRFIYFSVHVCVHVKIISIIQLDVPWVSNNNRNCIDKNNMLV